MGQPGSTPTQPQFAFWCRWICPNSVQFPTNSSPDALSSHACGLILIPLSHFCLTPRIATYYSASCFQHDQGSSTQCLSSSTSLFPPVPSRVFSSPPTWLPNPCHCTSSHSHTCDRARSEHTSSNHLRGVALACAFILLLGRVIVIIIITKPYPVGRDSPILQPTAVAFKEEAFHVADLLVYLDWSAGLYDNKQRNESLFTYTRLV